VLEDKADLAFAQWGGGNILTAKVDRAAIGEFQAGDNAQQGGLARTGWPQQGDQFTGFDMQVDIVQRLELTELFVDSTQGDIHYRVLKNQAISAGQCLWLCDKASPWRVSSSDFSPRVNKASEASTEAMAKAAAKLYSL